MELYTEMIGTLQNSGFWLVKASRGFRRDLESVMCFIWGLPRYIAGIYGPCMGCIRSGP